MCRRQYDIVNLLISKVDRGFDNKHQQICFANARIYMLKVLKALYFSLLTHHRKSNPLKYLTSPGPAYHTLSSTLLGPLQTPVFYFAVACLS